MERMRAPPSETRDRILDAVMNLIRGGGIHAVTLSAVCRLAGISKGGLVHHFPTKDSLIDAFLDRAAGQYLHFIQTHLAGIAIGRGRWAGAFLDLVLRQHLQADPGLEGVASVVDSDDQCAAVMLALIQSAGRGGIAGTLFAEVLRTLRSDGLSQDLATTLLIALDGFWFQSVIECPDEVRQRGERLRRQLHRQIRAEVRPPARQISRPKVQSS
jgi:AcrR family transcriptional regulator